jgi:creatinine amidohydrolase/Fe(II)-dependent formamide hydrolase-like protein
MEGDSVFLRATPEEFRARTEACQGVDGNPGLASAEKGRAMVGAIAERLAGFVTELCGMKVEVRRPPAVG